MKRGVRLSKKKIFVPYISANKSLSELTITAVLIGFVLAIVFGAANAYLGLKTGLTVSASIPAAVISMAILRGIFKRQSILENNIVQTMTTAGEALAAGTIFTLPALFFIHAAPSQATITFIVLVGGFLGVFMMVPLRRMLIVKEHEVLPYPEGTACAEVLKSGEQGGSQAKLIGYGFLIGGLFKIAGDGFHLFKTTIETGLGKFKFATLSMDTMPALLGVGYIIGPRIAGQMIAGGLLASVVFVPLIGFFGSTNPAAIFPAIAPIGKLTAHDIYVNYIRYIGAGAVAAGGLITLMKTLPLLISTVKDTFSGLRGRGSTNFRDLERTDRDIPSKMILIGIILLVLIIAFSPLINVGFLGALSIAIFGFLFVTVASRIVGIVGSTSMPVSGMTIATLLIVTILFKASGQIGQAGMIASLIVVSIVCVSLGVAGDISQDLKTGYLVGGTPWKQQVAMMIGVLSSGLFIGSILILFDQSYGLGSDVLPAPKAALMQIIAQGIMSSDLPWEFIFIGVALAVTIEFLGLNSLTVAVGFYLPLSVSTPIMIGGIVRVVTEFFAKQEVKEKRERVGTLFASGLIAGEALISVIIALLIVPGFINPEASVIFDSNLLSCLLFLALATLFISIIWRKKRIDGE
jgi:putative OPT family oligopeptide transporter